MGSICGTPPKPEEYKQVEPLRGSKLEIAKPAPLPKEKVYTEIEKKAL